MECKCSEDTDHYKPVKNLEGPNQKNIIRKQFLWCKNWKDYHLFSLAKKLGVTIEKVQVDNKVFGVVEGLTGAVGMLQNIVDNLTVEPNTDDDTVEPNTDDDTAVDGYLATTASHLAMIGKAPL